MQLIKIIADDGKEFKGTNYNDLYNEVNAHEAALRLKKEAEEAEKKARLEGENRSLERINGYINLLNKSVEDHQKKFGQLYIYFDNEKSKVQKYGTLSSNANIINGLQDGGFFRF